MRTACCGGCNRWGLLGSHPIAVFGLATRSCDAIDTSWDSSCVASVLPPVSTDWIHENTTHRNERIISQSSAKMRPQYKLIQSINPLHEQRGYLVASPVSRNILRQRAAYPALVYPTLAPVLPESLARWSDCRLTRSQGVWACQEGGPKSAQSNIPGSMIASGTMMRQ